MNALVIGIDVGGQVKGFHAVALRDKEITERHHSEDAAAMRAWCVKHTPAAIGVDAPCRWRSGSRPRAADTEMAREKIFCFATPYEDAARGVPFHQWMVNGAALYVELEKAFPLFDGGAWQRPVCFETFPQAVACALAGRVLAAKAKRFERKAVLEKQGIKTAALTSIDYVDAALCALTARHLVDGAVKTYGERFRLCRGAKTCGAEVGVQTPPWHLEAVHPVPPRARAIDDRFEILGEDVTSGDQLPRHVAHALEIRGLRGVTLLD